MTKKELVKMVNECYRFDDMHINLLVLDIVVSLINENIICMNDIESMRRADLRRERIDKIMLNIPISKEGLNERKTNR